ncbi:MULTISPECIES: hypothetical protein [Streptomyces]|uniref:Uncharacterized protein n=1 Tax=Streptomyces tsukubensis (strain DSM 42081 / NBRC 108919 / NRRL 18488 / 9993) TaxID=1114943 RepID=I2N4A5_STRT9|nr:MULTISPECIES: hypothetical protein [Streptomyces]AZK95931.1 hypothetical protein B7R87_20240 [Streptomyces tsukubensis]EIF91852.1 hypothetical protein [Streptomyces tsukubensis NRRL18488]MYS68528.1 hypothetical protein [Streptomyces sp. SID5473]QKM68050.1 hypothetical protein STSU_013545 [Streptomyces tsukubensis NRRL18488]TAI44450.1 hypothetical protein EWI31_13340 [Streptomyces tsukubensis]
MPEPNALPPPEGNSESGAQPAGAKSEPKPPPKTEKTEAKTCLTIEEIRKALDKDSTKEEPFATQKWVEQQQELKFEVQAEPWKNPEMYLAPIIGLALFKLEIIPGDFTAQGNNWFQRNAILRPANASKRWWQGDNFVRRLRNRNSAADPANGEDEGTTPAPQDEDNGGDGDGTPGSTPPPAGEDGSRRPPPTTPPPADPATPPRSRWQRFRDATAAPDDDESWQTPMDRANRDMAKLVGRVDKIEDRLKNSRTAVTNNTTATPSLDSLQRQVTALSQALGE